MQMKIARGRVDGEGSVKKSTGFTGVVWADPVVIDAEGATVNNVFFSPGARTDWHTHEQGQVLHVLSGQGKVGTRSEGPHRIRSGDTVWIEPGEEHWHGADTESYMVHLAVSLGGSDWFDAVTDAEHAADQ